MLSSSPAQLQPSPDGWLPPGGYAQSTQWAVDNREALDAYAEQIAQEGTAGEQLHAYLDNDAAASVPQE